MHAGTGGIHIHHLSLNEDVSGTSSISSSSKVNNVGLERLDSEHNR